MLMWEVQPSSVKILDWHHTDFQLYKLQFSPCTWAFIDSCRVKQLSWGVSIHSVASRQKISESCLSHLIIFFYFEGHSHLEIWQLISGQMCFFRTKQEQQICGLPDKVAGRVDKAANHGRDLPNGLGNILAFGWCWFPIMPVKCQVSVVSLKQ